MKRTERSTEGTSFHGVTITTSVNKLALVIGTPDWESEEPGTDKVNYEWDCETNNGDVFTIYDWKEYRDFSGDELIEFHIGSHSKSISLDAKKELAKELLKDTFK